jgi:hypothetical protein
VLRTSLVCGPLVMGLVLATAPVRAADVPDITGEYKSEITGPDGKTNSLTVTITKKGDTYLIDWESKPAQFGVGILQGDTLASSFYNKGGSGATKGGVGLYKIEKTDKGVVKLVGQWSWYPGDGKLYSETMTKEK